MKIICNTNFICYKGLTLWTLWTAAKHRSPKGDVNLGLFSLNKNFAHSTELVWNSLVIFFWNCFKSANTVTENDPSSPTASIYSHHFCLFVIFPLAVCLFQPFSLLMWKYWGSHSKREMKSCNQNEWDAIYLSHRLLSVVLCKEYVKKELLLLHTGFPTSRR